MNGSDFNKSAGVMAAAFVLASAMLMGVVVDAQDKLTLKCAKVDSEETTAADNKGAYAVDGNPETIWHTQWQDACPTCPHEIIIEIEPACIVKGISYLPRQDESDNGTIRDYEIYLSDDGKEFGQPVKKGVFDRKKDKQYSVFAPKKAKFVKLKALSEVNGEAWTSVAEIGVVQKDEKVTVTPDLKFIRADSEETVAGDNKAEYAIDKNRDTFWHTQWQDNTPACPHEIILQLDPPAKIKGFTYLPRQDDSGNGTIKDFEFYVSQDGKEFGKPVAKGTFENNKDKKTINFEPVSCSFIKLKALTEVNGEAWTSAAEIEAMPAD